MPAIRCDQRNRRLSQSETNPSILGTSIRYQLSQKRRVPLPTPQHLTAGACYCGSLSSTPFTYQFILRRSLSGSDFPASPTTVPSCLVIGPANGRSVPAFILATESSAIFFTSSGIFVNGDRTTMFCAIPPQVLVDFQVP